MIVFDTETTGFLSNSFVPNNLQPKIIEFAAVKLDGNFEKVGELEFLCNPNESLTKIVRDLTGITDADLKDKPTFGFYYDQVLEFFSGEKTMVAHNLIFDYKMLNLELERIGKKEGFPMPERKICTMHLTKCLLGKWLKLSHMHEILTSKQMINAHRAMDDVNALVECVKVLRHMELLK